MSIIKKNILHRNFYNTLDGIYHSFWLGKFINHFIKKGKKEKIEKEFNFIFISLKLTFNLSIILLFLEAVEKTKPIFGLKYVNISGKLREFPVLLNLDKQRGKAIFSLKLLIFNRKEWYLNQRIISEIMQLCLFSNHELLKQKNESFKKSITNRFNLRYAY